VGNDSQIYLVDDDEDYVELLQTILEIAGYQCTTFVSGGLFLEIDVNEGDLVILDLNMPGKDGIEVMRELTNRQKSPTFILISGFDDRVLHSAKQFAESKQLRVADTLTKPIENDKFVEVVSKAFAESRSSYQLEKSIVKETTSFEKESKLITVDDLKRGLEQREFVIHIQPQVHFSDGSLSGGEVLVRWQHPIWGMLFPDQFLPLAEEHKLMGELTEVVIQEAIYAYNKLRDAGVDSKLSINLSAQNIQDLALPEKLGALLKEHAIEPRSFILELTESEIITDTSAALDIFNRLRMKGFSLSIDDFGTGDSSLKRLYQSPFSELKIDQHFVSRIDKDPDAISIVKVCTLLAKEFKMQTVAEGIEESHIWDELKQMGCDIAQGYFIARPMPVDDYIQWALDKRVLDIEG